MPPPLDLTRLLVTLAHKRPLFYSEADFQHALAWELHEWHPDAKVRLEYRPMIAGSRIYVDIWAVLEGTTYALELKYKTRSLSYEHEGESYRLLNQGAQDQGRYDFLKDVARLEELTTTIPDVVGIALLLTNDSSYWQTPRSTDTVDAAFHIHEERSLNGYLEWNSRTSSGTMKSRENPLQLRATYLTQWLSYSQLPVARNGHFRCLVLRTSPT